jgi:acetamidase/formamidase
LSKVRPKLLRPERATSRNKPARGKDTLPDDISQVPRDYIAALETLQPGLAPHLITGPIYVRDADVGDALQIDSRREGATGLGFVSILPLLRTLPDEITEYETIHPRIDRQRNVCIMLWKSEIPLDPFFGIIATGPPPNWGRCGSPVPRAFGGNVDNKELRAETTSCGVRLRLTSHRPKSTSKRPSMPPRPVDRSIA